MTTRRQRRERGLAGLVVGGEAGRQRGTCNALPGTEPTGTWRGSWRLLETAVGKGGDCGVLLVDDALIQWRKRLCCTAVAAAAAAVAAAAW